MSEKKVYVKGEWVTIKEFEKPFKKPKPKPRVKPLRIKALEKLREKAEPMEFNDLVNELGLKHKTYLGAILNKLEKEGMVIKLVRKRNPIIGITEKGFERIQE
jgi:predicted transcriptional regulator